MWKDIRLLFDSIIKQIESFLSSFYTFLGIRFPLAPHEFFLFFCFWITSLFASLGFLLLMVDPIHHFDYGNGEVHPVQPAMKVFLNEFKDVFRDEKAQKALSSHCEKWCKILQSHEVPHISLNPLRVRDEGPEWIQRLEVLLGTKVNSSKELLELRDKVYQVLLGFSDNRFQGIEHLIPFERWTWAFYFFFCSLENKPQNILLWWFVFCALLFFAFVSLYAILHLFRWPIQKPLIFFNLRPIQWVLFGLFFFIFFTFSENIFRGALYLFLGRPLFLFGETPFALFIGSVYFLFFQFYILFRLLSLPIAAFFGMVFLINFWSLFLAGLKIITSRGRDFVEVMQELRGLRFSHFLKKKRRK